MLSKILVPTDFSRCAEAAVERAAVLALQTHAELLLLHVCDDLLPVSEGEWGFAAPSIYAQEGSDADAQLERAATALRKRGLRVRTLRVFGSPHAQIGKLADAEHVDLIMMGMHGCRALSRLVMGSVAERTIRSAHVPVNVVHDDRRDTPVARASS